MSRYIGVYEYFEQLGYKHDVITQAINMLPKGCLEDLHKREGSDLEKPVFMECVTNRQREFVKKVRIQIYPVVLWNLQYICNGEVAFHEEILIRKKANKKYFDLVGTLNETILESIIENREITELKILRLKFGLSNGKYYSNNEISAILNIDLSKIRNVVNEVLLAYKEEINNITNNDINNITYEDLEIKQNNLKEHIQ